VHYKGGIASNGPPKGKGGNASTSRPLVRKNSQQNIREEAKVLSLSPALHQGDMNYLGGMMRPSIEGSLKKAMQADMKSKQRVEKVLIME